MTQRRSIAPMLRYRPDIDGLRALAVSSVIIYHAFPAALPGGFVGVDIFFVISGYLISRIIFQELDSGNFSFARFYAHRIRRIFPALAVVLAVSMAMGWCLLNPPERVRLGRDVLHAALFITNLTAANETDYFDEIERGNPLLHLWSLGVEEQFYILWPALLVMTYHATFPYALRIAGMFFVSLCFWRYYGENPVYAFFMPHARFWELAAGAWVAAVAPVSSRLLSWLGAALLAVSLGHVSQANMQAGYGLLIPVLGSVCVLMGEKGGFNHILASRPLVCMGKISYPLYLIHWPVLCFLPWLVKTPSLWHNIGALLLSAAMAWLIYAGVEKPARAASIYKAGSVYIIARLSFLALCLVGAAGYVSACGSAVSLAGKMRMHRAAELDKVNSIAGHRCLKYPEGKLKTGQCALAERRPNVVIIGDSHSFALYEAMRGAYPFIRFILFGSKGCTISLRAELPDCRSTSFSGAEFIKRNPVDAVIVIMNWASKNPARVAWQESLSWLSSVQALQKHIILFRMWPIYRNTFNATAYVPSEPVRIPYTEASRSAMDVYKDIEAFAVATGMEFYDATPLFCDRETCLVSTGQALLYRDSSHLSAAGMRYLQGRINGNFRTLDRLAERWRRSGVPVR